MEASIASGDVQTLEIFRYASNERIHFDNNHSKVNVTPVSSFFETGVLLTEKYRIKPSYSKPNKISNTFNKINLKEIHLYIDL